MSDIQNFINTSVKAENGVVTYMDLLLKYPELNMVKAQQYDIFCLLIISLIPRELNQYHQNNPQFNTLKVSVEKGENSTRIVDGGDCYLVANGDYENALGLSFERYLKTTIPKYIQSQEVAITTEHVFQSDVKAENERKVKLQQLSSSNDKTTNSFDKDHNNDDLKQSITDVIKTTTFVDENKSKSPQQPSSNDEGVKSKPKLAKEHTTIVKQKQKPITSFFTTKKKETKQKQMGLDSFFKKSKRTMKSIKSDDDD